MTPEVFVAALKESVCRSAERTADYLANPPSPRPPDHLARFSTWLRRLPTRDQAVAQELIQYAADWSLFEILTYLDNLASLTEERGALELWYVGEDGGRVRLNDPNGELLNEVFNNAT